MAATFQVTDSLKDRFYAKVQKSESSDGCWLWCGGGRGNGYGSIKIEGRVLDVHRVAMVLDGREAPPEILVCHTCDNKRCVNPTHLVLGSYRDNVKDAVGKGLIKPFRATRTDPLTDSEIESILSHYQRGVSKKVIARKFRIAATSLTRLLAAKGV